MKRRPRQDLQIDFWPGFTDAILSVTLVLVFIICIFVVTQASLFMALSSRESALVDLSRQLDILEKALLLSGEEKSELQRKFDKNAIQLASSLGELDSAQFELERAEKDLDAKERDLEMGASDLEKTKADLDRIKAEIEKSRAALTEAEKRKSDAEAAAGKQKLEAEAGAKRIQDLAKKIEEYLTQLQTLNEQLGETEKSLMSRDASLLGLNESVKRLSERVSLLSAQLGSTKKDLDTKALELTKLLDEIERRDREIVLLKKFEKYKSEFLARLADVFTGMESVKVVGDRFVFQSEVLFPSGRADLTPDGAVKLAKFVMAYQSLEAKIPKDVGFNIQIQGHTDTDPIVRANFASNWELSTSRATSVVRFLVGAGIPADRLSAAGFSQYYPAASGNTDAAKRQNRRIEIFFTRR